MSRATADLSKITGVASLGILTGATSVLAIISHPSLTSLPALTPAPSFRSVQHTLETRLSALTSTSAATLIVAWILSPRGARHPYLLWTALPPLGVAGWGWWGRRQARASAKGYARGSNGEALSETGSESDEGWERDVAASGVVGAGGRAEVNGEMVREEIEAWGRGMQWRALAFGAGMLSGLLGLLGDVL